MTAGREAFLAAAAVSPDTAARLDRFVALLTKWNARINLVGRASMAEVWRRHIADSAQLLGFAPPSARLWADLGSGAGFPGLIVAMLAAEGRPQMQTVLVESDHRKAAFLAAAVRETGVRARVEVSRAETLPPLGADVVSARALAPLKDLLPLVQRHLGAGGSALLPKGAGVEAELAEALASWRCAVQKHASATDRAATILEVKGLARA